MISHLLKFFGLLCLMSLVSAFVPFGTALSAAVVFLGIWKLTE